MRAIALLMIFLSFTALSACEYSSRGKYNLDDPISDSSVLLKNCNDSLSSFVTSALSDSLHSLQIKTYSLFDSGMTKSYPCVTEQELLFKSRDSIINIEQVSIKERIFDSNKQCYFLKYVIRGIAVDSIEAQKVYMLYLFAANGEAEYNFFYNQRGKLLFFQRCDKKGCSIKCYDFDEKTAISYCNDDSRILNIKEINGICE